MIYECNRFQDEANILYRSVMSSRRYYGLNMTQERQLSTKNNGMSSPINVQKSYNIIIMYEILACNGVFFLMELVLLN